MHRLLMLAVAVVALFSLSASIAGAKVPGVGSIGTESTCAATLADVVELVTTADAGACGQDINYHAFDVCEPYPIVNAPYAWHCWNERDGWHPHYARI